MKDYLFDPSLNILYKEHHNLDYIFAPKNIAVIGATDREGSVGKTLLVNLKDGSFKGSIYPINPKKDSILDLKAYPSISKVPEKVDLVVIATPAASVPKIIKECIEANVKAAIIISAGFKELGEPGIKLENEIKEYAQGKIRIIGPNCLGVMNPINGINATFASEMALKGNIAFISQSGALCTAILDWSLKEKVGFSSFVSIGSMMDVNWGDLISYFGSDPNTHSILLYMESIGDSRAFLSAAREAALSKPIILIKAGKTKESVEAAASHTGALVGSDDVFDAALHRIGVLRVGKISDIFNMAEILSKQPLPKGPKLGIITNAGGPGVIATDALILAGGEIAKLEDKTYEELNKILPKAWSRNNPIDILGDANPDLYDKSIEILAKDPNTDGILVILTPQYMTDPKGVADKIKHFSKIKDKPILTSWMGSKSVEKGREILTEADIPTFLFPDTACKMFAHMWSYKYNLMGIYETPVERKILNQEDVEKKHEEIIKIFNEVKKEKRVLLDEYESKRVLEIYDIPIVETKIAKTKEEAIEIAKQMGFPIVLKLYSKTITHKTDVGGVKLNLTSVEDISKAFEEIYSSVLKVAKKQDFSGVTVQKMIKLDGYELIIGSSIDIEFGPVLLFGSGGQLVEVYKDSSLALPPLTTTLAKRMIKRTKIYEALKGVRGRKGVDLEKLEKILVRFSNLIANFPQIKEFDINPLLVSSDKMIALDARIILHEKEEDQSKLAIRPYPINYVQDWQVKDDLNTVIRPILPQDENLLKEFYTEISENSLKQTYLKVLHYDELIAHDRLVKICFNDYDREIALVIESIKKDGKKEILAIARLTKVLGSNDATFAILVKDKYHKLGIGKKLLTSLIEIAKHENVDYLLSKMFEDNLAMQNLCKSLGFELEKSKTHPVIFAGLKIS